MHSQLHCVFITCLLLKGWWTCRHFSFFIFRKDLAQSLLFYGRAEMLMSGLLQVEIDSRRIHDGNQDVDILKRNVKYLQDELGNSEWQAIKQCRGAWSDKDVQNSRRLKIQEIMEFENESKSLLQRIYEWFHPNMWMAMIIPVKFVLRNVCKW